jgi:hypothetical protein
MSFPIRVRAGLARIESALARKEDRMRKQKKRLVLSKETVRNLEGLAVVRAGGWTLSDCLSGCPMFSCPLENVPLSTGIDCI